MKQIVFTLGTSNRKIEEFLKILKKHKINLIIDVRRYPKSKFEFFNKESLEKILKDEGIGYLHVKELGGFKAENWRELFEGYVKSDVFKDALERVIEMAKEKRICLICAERDFRRCHREYIAKEIEKKLFQVIHL